MAIEWGYDGDIVRYISIIGEKNPLVSSNMASWEIIERNLVV